MPVTVGDLMHPHPSCIRPDATLAEAIELICRDGTPELYVTDDAERLLGVLPDYELLKANLGGIAGTATVDRFMTRAVFALTPDSGVGEAARVFRDFRRTRIAILCGGRLVGQISRRDVLRHLASAGVPATRNDVVRAPALYNPPSLVDGPRFGESCLNSARA